METEKEIEKEKVTKKQPVKLLTGLKKIACLNLSNEKIDYFQKESIFSSLLSVKKAKESSGTLIEALASFYNNVTQNFNFNGKVFSFCADEVAEVLKIPRGDLDQEAFMSTLPRSNSYPPNLYEIRNMLVENANPRADISAQDFKTIIEKMELETADDKKLFVQLLTFYYIELFALCGAKLTHPRSGVWKYVLDMNKFNAGDWPAIICNHLKISMLEAHAHLSRGKSEQHSFKGCAPVLEAILFKRLHNLYSGSMSTDLSPPPVQIYNAQRRTADEWKSLLLRCEITDCKHCPSPASTDEGASESPKRSTPSADTPPFSPPTSPSHNPISLERPLLDDMCESVSALQLGCVSEGEVNEVCEAEGEVNEVCEAEGEVDEVCEADARGRVPGRGRGRGRGRGKEMLPLREKSKREKRKPVMFQG